MSSTNKDIFLKQGDRVNVSEMYSSKKNNSLSVSSSLFTSETPEGNIDIDELLSDSHFLNKKMMDLHRQVLDSDYVVLQSEKSSYELQKGGGESSQSVESEKQSHSSHRSELETSETRHLPINSLESEVITPYIKHNKHRHHKHYSEHSEHSYHSEQPHSHYSHHLEHSYHSEKTPESLDHYERSSNSSSSASSLSTIVGSIDMDYVTSLSTPKPKSRGVEKKTSRKRGGSKKRRSSKKK